MALLSAEIGNAAPGTGLSGGRKVLCLIRFTLTRVDRLSSSFYLSSREPYAIRQKNRKWEYTSFVAFVLPFFG